MPVLSLRRVLFLFRSPLQGLEGAVVLPVQQLRAVVHLAQHWMVLVINLAVKHVDWCQDAFLAHGHGLVVDANAYLVHVVEVALAHVVALHQV